MTAVQCLRYADRAAISAGGVRHMRKLLGAFLLAVLPAGAASAGSVCPGWGGDTVFHCKIESSSREVSVCDMLDGTFLYVYGRPGRPELELRRSSRQVEYTPWNGIGRAIWARIGFSNGQYFYDVGFSQDKRPGSRAEGQIEIYKGRRNDPISIKFCRRSTVTSRLDELWDRF